jgi:hypothetical protein
MTPVKCRVRTCLTVVTAMACLLAPGIVRAQQRYVVPRLTAPVQLDGRSDEVAWQAIDPLNVVSSSPNFGAVAIGADGVPHRVR